MKILKFIFLTLTASIIISCSGSDFYRGSWNALNAKGEKYTIIFDEKKFAVKDSAGATKDYTYSQNSVAIKNSTKTYGIRLGDGRNFEIHFPTANNDGVGLIKDENGMPLFTISRNNFVSYEDIYKLE